MGMPLNVYGGLHMPTPHRFFLILAALSFHVAIASIADAQSKGVNSAQNVDPVPTRDPRLPPVFPGETVETSPGQKMKVWSSSGGVTTGQPPAPPGAIAPSSVDVIVDGRRRDRDRQQYIAGRDRPRDNSQ